MKKINLIIVLVIQLSIILVGCTNSNEMNLNEAESNKLTLEKVKELSEKGDALTWSDFIIYDTDGDIGSGLYIYKYPINEEYYILVGGIPEEFPYYVKLVEVNTNKSIDIRYEDIDEFIKNLRK